MAADDKVVIGQTHGADDAEAVLIGYLLGVEALRAGKQALMWLTKDGVHLATKGYSDDIVGARSAVDQRPSCRVHRQRRPLLRLPRVREDPRSRSSRMGAGRRSQRRPVAVRVHRGRSLDIQLLIGQLKPAQRSIPSSVQQRNGPDQ